VITFGEVMVEVALKSFLSWCLVAQSDEAIPPDVERLFAKRMGATVAEVNSNHLPMVSHPAEVVDLIESAAETIQQPDAASPASRQCGLLVHVRRGPQAAL